MSELHNEPENLVDGIVFEGSEESEEYNNDTLPSQGDIDIWKLLVENVSEESSDTNQNNIEGGKTETNKTENTKVEKDQKNTPEDEIDPNLTVGDMLTLIYAEITEKGVAGHHIESMNAFNRVGIKQIATKVFTVEGRQKNLRDKTPEDQDIAEIAFKVEFTEANLTSPTTVKYKSGAVQALLPNMARIKGLTYSAQLMLDATITATATYKSGGTKVKTAEIKNHRIASIPCMVGTELCHTAICSRDTLKHIEEDPRNSGGHYIINGIEWVIDNLENITNNTFHVYKNMYGSEIVRGTFLSKPGDAFENSYQLILRYLNNGAITIEITTNKFNKFELPYYVLFRALGMTRDRDIINNIVYGVDQTDPITREMLQILDMAFTVDDAKFGPILKTTEPAEIIRFIAQKITDTAQSATARRDENITKYLNASILNIFDRFIFPHIGTGVEHRIRKLRFLGHLINKLLSVKMGIVDQTDRDSYRNKRVYSAGTSYAKAFKTDFNFAVVQAIKRQLIKDFKTTPFSNVQLADSFRAAINYEDLERLLTQAITTGNKKITVRRTEIVNRISSQTLYRKNDMNVMSTMRTINTPNPGAAKQTNRADEMRRVQPSYTGYIDLSQSADSGEKVGLTKQMASTASICGPTSSWTLKQILLSDKDIIPLDDVAPERIMVEELAKVFVNGDWIGCCHKSYLLVAKYRLYRRQDKIHHLTTIVWEPLIREVYFWTDVGRMMRPLTIVYNNIEEYVTKVRGGKKDFQFKQWIKLTKDHIRKLRAHKLTMEDLRREGVIEYISPEEQESAYLAPNLTVLRKYVGDVTRQYTHMDIDQALFGIVTLAGPMANHSNAVRNTMYTNHRKQSAGWFAMNWPYLMLRGATLQHYCERPLVSTFSDSLTCPNGMNTIVALMLHGGENCEDSIKVNQSSVDCGAYQASFYNYERADLDKGEQFGNPDYARTMDIKKDAIYEHINGGFIAEGTLIKKGYVLVVKAAKIPRPDTQFIYVDKSVVYKRDEQVYVERVISTRNNDDVQIAKVKFRADRPMAIGDKFSSRSGNKGICAILVPRHDMPFCPETGLTPDLIVNAHSIPTRMAVNQITECVLAQLCTFKGTFADATPFRPQNIMDAVRELEKYGVKYGGHRRLYNGMTGVWIDTHIFIGPTTYQRLQKFVVDENYAIKNGPTSALTHQPLDGKNNDGGLRLGEMEKDCLSVAGVMRALFGKFYDDSDGIVLPICRLCGNRAIVNEKMGIYKCKTCGDRADIVNVDSAWVANVFFHESSSMNIKLKFGLEPFKFAQLDA